MSRTTFTSHTQSPTPKLITNPADPGYVTGILTLPRSDSIHAWLGVSALTECQDTPHITGDSPAAIMAYMDGHPPDESTTTILVVSSTVPFVSADWAFLARWNVHLHLRTEHGYKVYDLRNNLQWPEKRYAPYVKPATPAHTPTTYMGGNYTPPTTKLHSVSLHGQDVQAISREYVQYKDMSTALQMTNVQSLTPADVSWILETIRKRDGIIEYTHGSDDNNETLMDQFIPFFREADRCNIPDDMIHDIYRYTSAKQSTLTYDLLKKFLVDPTPSHLITGVNFYPNVVFEYAEWMDIVNRVSFRDETERMCTINKLRNHFRTT